MDKTNISTNNTNKAEALSILRGIGISSAELTEDINSYRFNFRGSSAIITTEEISLYKEFLQKRPMLYGTSIYHEGYYEHIIEIHGSGPSAFLFSREFRSIYLKNEQSEFELEISPASSNFILSLFDVETLDKDVLEAIRARTSAGGIYGRQNLNLRDLFHKFLSIKVSTPKDHAIGKKVDQLKNIAESGLYNVSYGHGVSLLLLKSWERSFMFSLKKRSEEVQFPLQIYNSDLVAYYQMALGSESPILSYLALYKIVEYLYTSVSESILHKEIKDHLLLPDFSHTKPAKLRSLARLIRTFDMKMNEQTMLQTVLEKYISKEGLKEWIEVYEAATGAVYTKERDIFGKTYCIGLSSNQIFPNTSNRIYSIRNALVHNKEGEKSRFTPFAGEEKILIHEVRLLLKIAEDLIQCSGKDIVF